MRLVRGETKLHIAVDLDDVDCRECGERGPRAYEKTGNICLSCHKKRVAAVYRRNATDYKRRVRDNELRKKYGLTRGEYERLLLRGCEICGSQKNLHIDHDHNRPGTHRGVLCRSCNAGIGLFFDNPALLRSAVEYLGGDAT